MSLRTMLRDRCTLVKADGRRFENILSGVHPEQITLIDDTKLPVEEGDIIERELPNGLREQYQVLDRGFRGSFPTLYHARVRKLTALPEEAPRQTIYNLNLQGPNARAYLNSHDASHNVVNVAPAELFDVLRSAIEAGISEQTERARLLSEVAGLERARGTPSFTERYVQFVGAIADHVSLLGPYLPALAQLLVSP